ncbi:MAG: invasion associated locus B family protein [Granulosicoccus sp.]|nr:invasion associated locus B family protein [Granulosicoccus sp.]
MKLRLALLLVATLPILPGLLPGTASAQSGGGLKLGPSEEPAGKLDLGAAPAADQEAPPAPPPTDVTPAASDATRTGERVRNGAWEVACGSEGVNCAMAQIGNDKSGTPVLEMVIRKLEEPLEVGERTAIAVLDVITPLGVVLTEGLSVTIDNGRVESAPFQICTEQGCLVREPIDSDLVSRFKRGNNAVISVVAANQGEVSASLSLSGFTKSYDMLK